MQHYNQFLQDVNAFTRFLLVFMFRIRMLLVSWQTRCCGCYVTCCKMQIRVMDPIFGEFRGHLIDCKFPRFNFAPVGRERSGFDSARWRNFLSVRFCKYNFLLDTGTWAIVTLCASVTKTPVLMSDIIFYRLIVVYIGTAPEPHPSLHGRSYPHYTNTDNRVRARKADDLAPI